MRVLVLNSGSSSLKCWYHELADEPPPSAAPRPLWSAEVEGPEDVAGAIRNVPGRIDVVGHRIVHGGAQWQSTLLTPEVRDAIARNAALDPEHSRRALALIETVDRVLGPVTPQVAVFDTAFHATLAPEAYTYPGPYEWLEQGIRRYGFHGISHRYASRRAAEILGLDPPVSRLVTCHLGNGASLAAVQGGKCIDTTMGFTPLEGLMMGSRSGSVDAGILIYLLRRGATADSLDNVLNKKSGLLGVSGVSADMRQVLRAIDGGDARAKLAFNLYAHRLIREIGSMAAVLGGLDALVFTGGVGENCTPLRDRVADKLAFLAPRIVVIHAEEEWEIARECQAVIAAVTRASATRRAGKR